MKRLTKYNDLYTYLESFIISDSIRPVMTTDNNDATSNLAAASGVQVLFARPEMKQGGRSDNHHSSIGTLAFVLEKGLGSANTKIFFQGLNRIQPQEHVISYQVWILCQPRLYL